MSLKLIIMSLICYMPSVALYVSRAERKCTGGAEQNCTTERRRLSVNVRGA